MDNYEMIGMIVVCGGALIAFIKPILDLKAVLTKLDTTLQQLQKNLDDINNKNDKEHCTFFDITREQGQKIAKLEADMENLKTNHIQM